MSKILKVSVSVSKLRPTNEKSRSHIWMSLEIKLGYLPNLQTYFQLKNEVGAVVEANADLNLS